MGLFGLFSAKKTIQWKEGAGSDAIVSPFDSTKIEIGSKLQILPNQLVVFMARDKVTDCLGAGEYKIGPNTLPLSFEMLRRAMSPGKKKPPRHIILEGYFVNTSTVQLPSTLSELVVVKFGRKNARLRLNFSISVSVGNAMLLVRNLRVHDNKITEQGAKKIISDVIEQVIPKAYEQTGNLGQKLSAKEPEFIEEVRTKINKDAINFGFCVDKLIINSIVVPEKLKDDYEQALAATTTLHKEINEFLKEEPAPVVFEKVGTEAILDKTLEVKVISGEPDRTQTEFLNIPTGEDAQKEIVFARTISPEEFENGPLASYDFFGGKHPENEEENMQPQQNELASTNDLPQFCTRCGNKLRDGDLFCGRCGTKIN